MTALNPRIYEWSEEGWNDPAVWVPTGELMADGAEIKMEIGDNRVLGVWDASINGIIGPLAYSVRHPAAD